MGNRTAQVAAEPTVELSVVVEQPELKGADAAIVADQQWLHWCVKKQEDGVKTIIGACPHCKINKPLEDAKANHETPEDKRTNRIFCCKCTLCIVLIVGAIAAGITCLILYGPSGHGDGGAIFFVPF